MVCRADINESFYENQKPNTPVMNQIIPALLIVLMLLFSSCKKDETVVGDQSDNPTQPEWQLFNTANSALPDNQVNAIGVSRDNTKWIGTANGLVRIAGKSWTIFNTGNSLLPSSFIQAVAIQPDGTVWVGTNNGLAKFDGNNWSVYNSSNSVMPENAVMSLAFDPNFKRTWIGTSKGLVMVDNDNKWHFFDDTAGDLLHSLATDQNGNLWLGVFNHFQFQGRIRKFDMQHWVTYKLNDYGYASTFVYSLAVNKNNEVIALLTGTSVSCVVRVAGAALEEIPRSINATGIRTLLLDDTKMWAAGNGFSMLGNATMPVIKIPGEDHSILSIAKDSANSIWLGTLGGGLAIYKN